MPELPEVETVVRGLRAVLPGRRILSVRLGKTDFIEDPAALERDLPGSRVTSVRRHGKFIVVELEDSNASSPTFSLLIHLGMTGQIVVGPLEAPVAPHTHVFFALDDGREFRYTDIRRFGKMRILSGGTQESALGKLGLDPLEATLRGVFRARAVAARANQGAPARSERAARHGEHLYGRKPVACAHPSGAAGREFEGRGDLAACIAPCVTCSTQPFACAARPFPTTWIPKGQRGSFQQRHKVYQRKGKKCFRCGTLIRRAIVAGRSSYFCPRCQAAPRRTGEHWIATPFPDVADS